MEKGLVILENPYASAELLGYLEESGTPVLHNEAAVMLGGEWHLRLTDEQEFIRLYREGARLYTASENALSWVYEKLPDPDLIRCVDLMKNKMKFRELLKTLFPGFFFLTARLGALKYLNYEELPAPFVIKPTVGFFSLGVYTVYDKKDWENAVADILSHTGQWEKEYPGSVIGSADFIIEQYIEGDEYAIDAYYDENGEAVVLNIMQHDFASSSDVSDRLYYTDREVVEKHLPAFTAFLNRANHVLKAVNFPFHAEVRVSGEKIAPIEFNPLRFAGWCCTDLSWFAYGFRTYAYFLEGKKPDWPSIFQGRQDRRCAMIVLNKPAGLSDRSVFDYDALSACFSKVLCLRKADYKQFSTFGFLFVETPCGNTKELSYIMKSDLREFIRE